MSAEVSVNARIWHYYDDDDSGGLISNGEFANGGTFVAVADYAALQSRNAELVEALNDFATHGLRFDLNPTHDLSYVGTDAGNRAAEFWHAYIKRMDESVRERARAALSKSPGAA